MIQNPSDKQKSHKILQLMQNMVVGGENHETFEQKQHDFGFNNIGLRYQCLKHTLYFCSTFNSTCIISDGPEQTTEARIGSKILALSGQTAFGCCATYLCSFSRIRCTCFGAAAWTSTEPVIPPSKQHSIALDDPLTNLSATSSSQPLEDVKVS